MSENKTELGSHDVAFSKTIMTELIMPNDTNPLGNLMGGNLMRWMDIAGGICGARHCGAFVVTASLDHVSFRRPIHVGDVITVTATVTKAFNTSVEVFIEVTTEEITGHNVELSNTAYMTFVALDAETKRPIPVPKVNPVTEQEKEFYGGASRRREMRLILGGRMQAADADHLRELFENLPD